MFDFSSSPPGYSSLIPFFQYYSNHKLKFFLENWGDITQAANYSSKSTMKITEHRSLYVFYKKAILRNFLKFTENTCAIVSYY